MHVSELMSAPAVTVAVDAPFKAALDLMVEHRVSGLPVVDEAGRVVGVVTEADVVSKHAYGGRRHSTVDVISDLLRGGPSRWEAKGDATDVGQMASSPAIVARPEEDVRTAARRMAERRVKRLPVVDDDGRALGVLSRSDVLRLFHRSDFDIHADILERLDNPRWSPEDTTIWVAVDEGVARLTGYVPHPMDVPVVEAAVWSVPGVIAVDSRLRAREPDPKVAI